MRTTWISPGTKIIDLLYCCLIVIVQHAAYIFIELLKFRPIWNHHLVIKDYPDGKTQQVFFYMKKLK